jgi:acetoin utilization protein AcuB
MIVRNWMQNNPLIVPGNTLAAEAKHLLLDNNIIALLVVDNGRLRGMVTRVNMMRMGHYVMRTQNPEETSFFVNRLKVRDIMVRNLATLQADDTMEHCLRYGKELGVAQFPVLEGELVVGVISAREIFHFAAHCLGAWERRNGVTLAPLVLGPGVLGRIADAAESAGAVLHAIYPIGRHEFPTDKNTEEKTVLLRLHTDSLERVVAALEQAGFPVSESGIPKKTNAA